MANVPITGEVTSPVDWMVGPALTMFANVLFSDHEIESTILQAFLF